MILKHKHAIKALSYRPEQVRDHEAAGLPIIDIVTASKNDPDLLSWVKHFKSHGVPIFAMRGLDRKKGGYYISLWKRDECPAGEQKKY